MLLNVPGLFVALVIISVAHVLALVVIWMLVLVMGGASSREVPPVAAFVPSIRASAVSPGSSTASQTTAWVTFAWQGHVLL